MSRVKLYSFTVGRDSFSIVTPLGLITAQRGEQITIAVSETWEAGADAIRIAREKPEPEPK